ncbi:MAG TPA: hypothetical protein VK610_06245, partial [Rhodothermales bacterium]|nr:hypothetical protein [Rhodothermales bacterium]
MPGPAARLASVVLTCALFAPAAFAQAGALDPTFGAGGRVQVTTLNNGRMSDVALQPDGRALVSNPYVVARLTPGGALDPTFGGGGFVMLPDGTFAYASALAVLDDGRFYTASGFSTLFVARFHADGRRDSTFSEDGVAQVPLPPWGYIWNLALAVQPDGRLVVAGVQRHDDGSDHIMSGMLARLTADGALDATFGNGGVIGSETFRPVYDVAVRPDGRILAVGAATVGTQSGFGLFRFLPSGAPDPTFGSNGVIATSV